MKIMWLSVAPWANTGYGSQTAIFTPRIKQAGHDIAISSLVGSQWINLDWEGIKVYPADVTKVNKRMLKHHIRREYGSADDVQVITLFDIWPFVDREIGGMEADFDGLNIASWVPVDSTPLPVKTAAALDRWNIRPIAMSKHGEEQLRTAGYDPLYVPHGIETGIYQAHEDRMLCRREVGIPEDKFVVGMVAHNEGITPPRKAFPQVLQAFAELRHQHEDAFLYLHTEVLGFFQGLNLLQMAEKVFGIPADSIGFVSQMNYLAGEISRERMSRIYASMDVLVNPSMGEGFGIPIVEAQACGTPVITSHFTSMPELTGAGWTVGGLPVYQPPTGAFWWQPAVDEVYAAMEKAYEARDDQALRDKAREFALQYDADRVFSEYWLPALDALERPREVAPLPLPNRAVRRAAKKAGVAA